MNNTQLITPVLLIIFRRPEQTKKVFEAIRKVKPKKLFIAADGPRPNVESDIEKCTITREIIDSVDWDCEVFKDFSEKNLGVGLRPTSAIHWVFEHVEDAIILEDDCLPNSSFFYFCQELLEKYRNNSTVMSICGTSQEVIHSSPKSHDNFKDSYFFSRYFIPWGWATWKRAWQHHDFELKRLKGELDKNWAHDFLNSRKEAEYWIRRLNKHVYNNPEPDAWDYQWQFSVWQQNGLYIIPKVNLISNIGFTQDATHINIKPARVNESIQFPIEHPSKVERAEGYDQLIIAKHLREDAAKKYKRLRKNIYWIKKQVKKLVTIV